MTNEPIAPSKTDDPVVDRSFSEAVDHLLNNVNEAFALIDVEGRVRRANIAYRRLTGPRGGSDDASIINFLDADQQEVCRATLKALSQQSLERTLQLRFQIGREERLIDAVFNWLGTENLIAFVGHDVTDEGRYERERQENMAGRIALEKVAPVGHWRVGQSQRLSLSQGAIKILGLDPAAPSLEVAGLLAIVEEGDRERVEETCRDAIDNHKSFLTTARIVRADGKNLVVRIAGMPSLDGRGKLDAMHGIIADKTDSDASIIAAMNSDSTVRQFMSAAPIPAAMMDKDMRVLMASDPFFSDHRLNGDNAIGHSLYDLAPWIPEKWREVHRRVLRGETLHNDCDPVDMPDGRRTWTRWSCAPWRHMNGEVGGIIILREDVTAAMDAKHAVETSKERMDLGLSMSAIMIWELDFERREVHLEGDWKQLFPERPTFDAITGAVDWVHENDREVMASKWRAHLAGAPPYSVEYRVQLPDGREIWHSASYRVMKSIQGAPTRALAVVQDITDRKRIESKALEAEQRALVAGSAKSDFLSNMSHEIRTPLNGVLAVSEMLARTEMTEKQTEMVKLIANSGQTLLRVMDDLVEFSRLEAEQIDFEIRPFELEDTLRAAADLGRTRAESKGLEFECFISANIDGVYRGDPTRISQVISNLLNNAVKFTEEGYIRINASVNEVDDKNELKILVEDSGIGFSDEVAARIFDRFEQADVSTSRKYGGLGLGLSIVKRLVEGMNGDIKVTSKEGDGSVFEVLLPIDRDKIAALGAINAVEVEGLDAHTELGNVRLLVAEDNPMNRRVVELLMAQSGIEITFAENGKEAIEVFQDKEFDMVLMDLQMPVVGGLQATEEIRKWELAEGRISTPIIALSANATDEHVAEAKAAGADDHVAKPIVRETLFEAIAKYARPSATSNAAGDDDDFDLDDLEVAV